VHVGVHVLVDVDVNAIITTANIVVAAIDSFQVLIVVLAVISSDDDPVPGCVSCTSRIEAAPGDPIVVVTVTAEPPIDIGLFGTVFVVLAGVTPRAAPRRCMPPRPPVVAVVIGVIVDAGVVVERSAFSLAISCNKKICVWIIAMH